MAVKTTEYGIQTTNDEFGKIGVLMGGPSSEREVSFKSGNTVLASLRDLGLNAVGIDITTEDIKENIRLIGSQGITCAFLALHGRFGEDGQIQGILDKMGIVYTGSDKKASKLAMDKIASRSVFEKDGLPVPRYKILEKKDFFSRGLGENNFIFPLVVKPAAQGSSIGLSIVDKKKDLTQALNLAFNFDEKILLEEYIAGREFTVGILEDQALPVVEIIPKKRFFDYEAKYSPGLTDYIVPAQIKEAISRRIQAAALCAHRLLGCYAYSRVDLILGQDNSTFVLEVNTIPGFTETSLFPKAAKLAGIEFSSLCVKLIRLAYEKK